MIMITKLRKINHKMLIKMIKIMIIKKNKYNHKTIKKKLNLRKEEDYFNNINNQKDDYKSFIIKVA